MDIKEIDGMKDLVSVIIPVYNVSEFLDECVYSIINQTYENLEIILVDDGSLDNSGQMCDSYARNDSRLVVVHKKNGGLSSARNVGLDIAKGEYIFFLDSDDVLSKDAIEGLLKCCKSYNADVVISPLTRFTKFLPKESSGGKVEVEEGKEAIRKMLIFKWPGHEACGKLFRRQLWEDIRFPLGELYEDYQTIYKILVNCNRVAMLEKSTYYYRMRENSIMNAKIREKELTIIDISARVIKQIVTVFPDLKEEAEYMQLVTYMKNMERIISEGYTNHLEAQRRIIRYAHENANLLSRPWVRKKDKIKLVALLIGVRFFHLVYKIGNRKNIKKINGE